jgi:branched-chain amino acid transport system substrate-binding protein
VGVAGLAATPLLSACGQTAPPAAAPTATGEVKGFTTSPTPQAPAAGKTATVLRIQSIQPLTGPSASFGNRVHAGSELAVKEINDAGGFQDGQGNSYTIELIKQDMANDRNEAIALLRQAAGDSSILVNLGPCNSVGFLPMVPVAGQVRMPLIGNGSGPPLQEWNTYTVRVNPAIEIAMPIFTRTVVNKLSAKRIAMIYDQTQDGQVASYNAAKRTAQEMGVPIVADTSFRTGEQDFSAQIATIKESNPDVVGVYAAVGDGSKVTLQIKEAGITAPMMTPDGAFLDTVYWDNAQGAFKGGFTWIAADLEGATGGLKKFLDDYAMAYPNLSPTQYSTYGFDSVHAAVEAVKRSGTATDRERFAQTLRTLEFTTPLGSSIKFQNPPTGDNLNPVVTTIQITDRGQYVKVE